jgi:hypothetical protein
VSPQAVTPAAREDRALIPLQELESLFLRRFSAFGDVMLQALRIRLGPVADSLSFPGDRIQFLAALGIHDKAKHAVAGNCFRIYLWILLSPGQGYPGRPELTHAAEAIRTLQTNLTEWIAVHADLSGPPPGAATDERRTDRRGGHECQ